MKLKQSMILVFVCSSALGLSCGSGTTDATNTGTDTDRDPITDPFDTNNFPDLSETQDEDCPDLDSLEGYPAISYYRLRFEYAASSDWSRLDFVETKHIVKVRTMSIEGEANKALAEYDGITVNQAKEKAQAGAVVTVTADYAFRPEAIDSPLSIKLGQGSMGSISVKISTVIGDNVQLIKEVTESNEAEFLVDLSTLKDVAPSVAPIAPVRRMAWALYYPWYSMNSWGAENLRDQPETPYDSGDPVAIERQIQQAKSAGIDGFISSWWGPDTRTDSNLSVVLDVAGENEFFVGMFLETKSILEDKNQDMALVEDELVRWIEFYVTQYGDHPGTMKVDGKSFIMPWITCTVPVDTWKNMRARLRAKDIEITLIADCQKPEYFDVFDGANGKNVETGKTLRYYAVLADNPTPKIWTSDGRPGYDERLLDRENPRYTDREDGAYFRRELNEALSANPQWIRLYTWNEYPENTYIEPSKNFGDKYLKIAAEYLQPWKCLE